MYGMLPNKLMTEYDVLCNNVRFFGKDFETNYESTIYLHQEVSKFNFF